MTANYHTHTWRCQHAEGTEESYIQQAILSGFSVLGFSDHCPQIFGNNYISPIRMLPEQLVDYYKCLDSLRNCYRDQIHIDIGVEAEYYPRCFQNTLHFLQDAGVEYMILGQHFIPDEPGWVSTRPTEDTAVLKQYCYQVMDAAQTGLFTYAAHPDLIHFIGDSAIYRKHMRDMVRELRQSGLPAEINLLGLAEGRHYPSQAFLDILAEESCPVILGCDAHQPSALSHSPAWDKALKMVTDHQLELLDVIPLRRIS